MPGFIFAGLRNILAGFLTCAFFLLKGHKVPNRDILWIMVKRGFLLVVVGNALVHWAEQYISSGLAAILAAMVPLWVAVISVSMFNTAKMNSKIILGLILGFVGILSIFWESLEDFSNTAYVGGIIAMVIAAFGWALGSVYSGLRRVNINLVYGAGLQMLTGGIIASLIGLTIGERVNLLELPMISIWAMLYLALIGSILTYNAYMYTLSILPPTQVSIYAYINPIVAVILGWLILDEKLNWLISLSVGVTLLGVYMVNRGFNIKKIKIDQTESDKERQRYKVA